MRTACLGSSKSAGLMIACVVVMAAMSMGAIQQATADDAPTGAKKTPRLLFVTQSFGFKHTVVDRKNAPLSIAEQAVIDWGKSSGLYIADCTQDVKADLTKENLQNYDLLMDYTTGKRGQWPLDDATLDYICNDWVTQKGHGFIGLHTATDTLEDYQPYWEMVGGSFNDHPWISKSHVTISVDDSNNPITKPWGKGEFEITDEIYQFKNFQPEKVHVLMSLDIGRSVWTPDINKRIKEPYFVPVAWCKRYGDGKVFYLSLGHNEAVWADPRYRDSVLGGIRWELGLEPGDATPNPELSAARLEQGKADVAAQREKAAAKQAAQTEEQK